jgi:hypothetical protein
MIVYVIDENELYFFNGSSWQTIDSTINHNLLDNLLSPNDDHTQYAHLSGRTGGQGLYGGISPSENLTLDSTTSATKGRVITRSNIVPIGDDQLQVGEAGRRFNAVYTNDLVTGDLNLKKGDAHWTFVEKRDSILVLNRKTGKSYRMVLEELGEREEKK